MKTSQFSFELPEELIAQEPAVQRDGARLMVLDRVTGKTTDSSVHDLASWIEAGTVVVLNDTRVRKARVFAESPGGGRAEFLLLARRDSSLWETLAGRAKRLKPGQKIRLSRECDGHHRGRIVGHAAHALRSADRRCMARKVWSRAASALHPPPGHEPG